MNDSCPTLPRNFENTFEGKTQKKHTHTKNLKIYLSFFYHLSKIDYYHNDVILNELYIYFKIIMLSYQLKKNII